MDAQNSPDDAVFLPIITASGIFKLILFDKNFCPYSVLWFL